MLLTLIYLYAGFGTAFTIYCRYQHMRDLEIMREAAFLHSCVWIQN